MGRCWVLLAGQYPALCVKMMATAAFEHTVNNALIVEPSIHFTSLVLDKNHSNFECLDY